MSSIHPDPNPSGVAYFKVNIYPRVLRAGDTLDIGVTAFDSHGRVVGNFNRPLTVSNSTGPALHATFSWNRGQGTASTVIPRAGTYWLTVRELAPESATGTSESYIVKPAPQT